MNIVTPKRCLIGREPDMWWFYDFIKPEEIEHILDIANNKYERSHTSKGPEIGHQKNFNHGISQTRTSLSARIPYGHSKIIRDIEQRVADSSGYPIEHVEQLMVIKYEVGQEFKEHHDGAFRPVTILLYLNNVPQGGKTEFTKIGVLATPLKGCALMWKNSFPDGKPDYRTLHRGHPPLTGIKYAVNCFVNVEPIRLSAGENQRGLYWAI
eukprot:GHVL01044086.1.p1 GENE.GHVL01044086.1~~GHVL01044086.1.p1  ORF type:complete len:210 (+),score=38.26 GHVL01044086.1:35-664(+)